MKCDNLFIDSCPVGCVSQSHLVHRPSQFPTHQAVDGWVWALKVIGCFCAQYLYHSDALSDVREILFARCGFVLLASPFQWSWLCDGAHVFYCRTFSILSRNHVLLFYSTTVHVTLCEEETALPVYRQSESSSRAGRRWRCHSPFSAPCVWHCHRREGGAEDFMYQPVIKLSQI